MLLCYLSQHNLCCFVIWVSTSMPALWIHVTSWSCPCACHSILFWSLLSSFWLYHRDAVHSHMLCWVHSNYRASVVSPSERLFVWFIVIIMLLWFLRRRDVHLFCKAQYCFCSNHSEKNKSFFSLYFLKYSFLYGHRPSLHIRHNTITTYPWASCHTNTERPPLRKPIRLRNGKYFNRLSVSKGDTPVVKGGTVPGVPPMLTRKGVEETI
jgi:hypothetical protein